MTTTATKNPTCGTTPNAPKPGEPGYVRPYWGASRCYNTGKVLRDGTWYCGVHDPVAKQEKRQAKDDARRAEWDRQAAARREWQVKDDARKADALRRIEALGLAGATPHTSQGCWSGAEYTGGVVLRPEAVDALLARLQAAEEGK